MGSRMNLQILLESILPQGKKAYYQPPSNITLNYPCIIYERSRIDTDFADDASYKMDLRYDVMVITKNPDDPLPLSVARLPRCTFNRHFVQDNLYHDVFTMYF